MRAEDEDEHRRFERDPFIYFYEDFLKAYDPAMRKSRHHHTPEEILGYIYAVPYAPTHRRYAEFLRIDFPRIPFPDEKADFDQLSTLGWALVQAHLLRDVPRPAPRRGSRSITAVAITWSKRCAGRPRRTRCGSTRSSASPRCRKPRGTSASAATRCWTNT